MTIEELKERNGYYKMSESEKRDFNKWLEERRKRLEWDRECAQWAEENPHHHDRKYFFGD